MSDENAQILECITETIGEAMTAIPEKGWQDSVERSLVVHLAFLLRSALQACRLLWDCRNHVPRRVGEAGGLLGMFRVQGSALWFHDGRRFCVWDLESEQPQQVIGAKVFLPEAVRTAAAVTAREQRDRKQVH